MNDVAREMADSTAARKQAEGAHRQLQKLSSGDAEVRINFR